jgi:glutathione S-transferase
MLKLYGFAVSNYFNMVKFALDFKGIDYEQVTVYPNQEADFLLKSPMGKVPVLETDKGCLVETNVMLEFLDESYGGPSLYPKDVFEKARVKELIKMMELYLELSARRCFAEAFFGGKVSDEIKLDARQTMLKGIRAVAKVASFSPYIAGESLTAADIMFLYCMDVASGVAGKVLELDLLADLPQAKELLKKLAQEPVAIEIAKARDEQSAAFYKYVSSKM